MCEGWEKAQGRPFVLLFKLAGSRVQTMWVIPISSIPAIVKHEQIAVPERQMRTRLSYTYVAV